MTEPQDLGGSAWRQRRQLRCLVDEDLCFLLSFLDHVGVATKEQLLEDIDATPRQIGQAITRLAEAGYVVERRGGGYGVSRSGGDILSLAGLRPGATVLAAPEDFAEIALAMAAIARRSSTRQVCAAVAALLGGPAEAVPDDVSPQCIHATRLLCEGVD